QTVHSSLAAHITPYNLAARSPELAAQLATHTGTAALNAGVTRQAAMIAYIDDFHLMLILTVLSVPLLFFVRKALPSKGSPQIAIE
ncbi:MAG: EmrB/QacA family drug resistance transporter, partial [Stenotrophobium sp.]